MKQILTLAITLFSLATLGQKVSEVMGQQMTSEKWDEEAKTNIRLLPKYGHAQKTEAQKKSDQELIESALKLDSTNRKASDHLISVGFKYLYRDIQTAMYRFNQAYLLDSTNTDIYWGFGAVYLTLGEYEKAKKQYLEGLSINPNNTHLLTDYGTYFMAQYYPMQMMPKNDYVKNPQEQAMKLLDSAITYMTKSYQLDTKDPNTTYKLSICYWNKGDCDNAWRFYNECVALGGQPITEDYTKDLKKKCKRKK